MGAGWVNFCFSCEQRGQIWLFGRLWLPCFTTVQQLPLYLGAKRPTSLVSELSAVAALLLFLRLVWCKAGSDWYTDSLDAQDIVNGSDHATTKLGLAQFSRHEVAARCSTCHAIPRSYGMPSMKQQTSQRAAEDYQ